MAPVEFDVLPAMRSRGGPCYQAREIRPPKIEGSTCPHESDILDAIELQLIAALSPRSVGQEEFDAESKSDKYDLSKSPRNKVQNTLDGREHLHLQGHWATALVSAVPPSKQPYLPNRSPTSTVEWSGTPAASARASASLPGS